MIAAMMSMCIDRHLGSEERRRFRRKREDDCDSAAVASRHEADLRFVVDVVHDRVVLCKYSSRKLTGRLHWVCTNSYIRFVEVYGV